MISNHAVLLSAVLTIGVSLPGWGQIPRGDLNTGAYQYQPSYQQAQPYYQQPQPPVYQQRQAPVYQQQPVYQPQNPGPASSSPQDLSNLVAPIALYPDLLLSQVLAASTYPAEITQAQQFIEDNANLRGQALVEAAKQQPWDPSVQALVAFPEVMSLLARDIQWTTELGNAFLAQQAAVMDAIQQLRASARNNGRLADTPQQQVTLEDGDQGQNAIAIQPTNPQMVYPPVYNPEYIWGPPAYGAYPALGYPPPGDGIVYGVGSFLGGLFSGLLNFGGWGWGLNWLTHGLFLNGLFFNHFGFHGYGGGYGGGFGGSGYGTHMAWVHNPSHRLGVPYGNRFAGNSFAGRGYSGTNYRGNYSGHGYASATRPAFNYSGGNRQMEAYRGLTGGNAGYGGRSGGFNSSGSGYRGGGYSSYSQARYSAPAYGASRGYSGMGFQGGYRGGYSNAVSTGRGFSTPRASSSFSGGRGFGGGQGSGGGRGFSSPHYSAPKSFGHFGGGGGHSSGGGHSHGGGGHSHGGGGHRK